MGIARYEIRQSKKGTAAAGAFLIVAVLVVVVVWPTLAPWL
jgi:hypothetical protein